jgi:hypothetical protein
MFAPGHPRRTSRLLVINEARFKRRLIGSVIAISSPFPGVPCLWLTGGMPSLAAQQESWSGDAGPLVFETPLIEVEGPLPLAHLSDGLHSETQRELTYCGAITLATD